MEVIGSAVGGCMVADPSRYLAAGACYAAQALGTGSPDRCI